MGLFCALGFMEKELSWLNRAPLHQQALFVLDVMDAGVGQLTKNIYLGAQTQSSGPHQSSR
jgi:hypothetical protein